MYNNQTSVKNKALTSENRAFQSATQHKPSRYLNVEKDVYVNVDLCF